MNYAVGIMDQNQKKKKEFLQMYDWHGRQLGTGLDSAGGNDRGQIE